MDLNEFSTREPRRIQKNPWNPCKREDDWW